MSVRFVMPICLACSKEFNVNPTPENMAIAERQLKDHLEKDHGCKFLFDGAVLIRYPYDFGVTVSVAEFFAPIFKHFRHSKLVGINNAQFVPMAFKDGLAVAYLVFAG